MHPEIEQDRIQPSGSVLAQSCDQEVLLVSTSDPGLLEKER